MVDFLIKSIEIDWKPITLNRGEYLITPGQVEKSIYLVQDGAVRAFILKEDEDHTVRFGYSGSIITAIPSYFTAKPTELYIQAIRKTKLLQTQKKKFETFINKDLKSSLAYQQILKDLVSSFFEREIDLLTKSPAERLDRIKKRSPKLFQEVPYKYIASYLRMAPETLSRLLKS